MTGLLLLLCAILPPELPHIEDEVDTLETNHVYADSGCFSFTQLIGWDGLATDVCFWRMVQSGEQGPRDETLLPMQGRDGWFVMFEDKGVTRVVRAPYRMDYHAQTDVEVNQRENRPKELRRELRPVTRPPFVRELP